MSEAYSKRIEWVLKSFDSALSIVLGNAKDWQSERRKRIVGRALSTNRIKKPHRQEESETDSELQFKIITAIKKYINEFIPK